jgi:hypothetical protein
MASNNNNNGPEKPPAAAAPENAQPTPALEPIKASEREAVRSNADLEREILEVELETKRLLLGKAKKENSEFHENEERRKAHNRQRMAELAEARRNHEAVVKNCRHKSGGEPDDVLKGGGIGSFSIISRAIMPDGISILLQCPRCRMKMYPPTEKLKQENKQQYLEDLALYNQLLEKSKDDGIRHSQSRGPTFMFKNENGVPVVPERK